MKKRGFIGFALLFVLVAAVVAAGCIGGETTTQSPTSPTETTETETTQTSAPKHEMLVIGYTRDPDTLDVHKSTWIDITTSIVFAPLINLGTNGEIIPGLAESEVSEDGKVITFHLRKGIKDALGNPITAEDVKFDFDRYKNPKTKSPSVGLYLGPVEEVKVIDDYTVQLIYKEPYGPALTFATMQSMGVFSKEYFESVGEVEFGQHPVATGPYYVTKWVRGAYIDYERNPYYKREYNPDPTLTNPGPPYIENVRFRIIKEPFTMISEFEKGNVHVLLDVPTEYYKQLKDNPHVTMIPFLEYVLHYIGFNCQKYPFNDTRVRQAINMAINRDPIVEYGVDGLAVPIHGPLVPTMMGYSQKMEDYAKQKYPYDPEKAKELLAEAGWKDRDGDGILEDSQGRKFEVEMWVSTGEPEAQKVAQIIQDQLKQVGIKVNIRIVEESSFTDLVSQGKHQMYLLRYGLMDAQILFYMFHSTKGVKRMFFYRSDLDEALEKMGTTVDPTEREKYIEEAEKILTDGAPMVPLYARKVFIAYRNDIVEGIKVNSYTQGIYLDDAKLK